MNKIFVNSAKSLVKIIVLAIIAYYFIGIFLATSQIQMAIGIFFTVFISLPAIFIMFFKKKWDVGHPTFAKVWKVLRFFYVFIVILFVALTVLGIWHLGQLAKTQKTIDFINSKKITLDDVMGKNLPPVPDQKLNDATIAGIDANKNYIRDDVELAIFKKYPNSAKIRAAELQYAQALQLELTKVFNSMTLVAVQLKRSKSRQCIDDTGPEINLKDSHEKILADYAVGDNRKKEVDDLVINTNIRVKKQSNDLNKYTTTYSVPPSQNCDIELSSLPN